MGEKFELDEVQEPQTEEILEENVLSTSSSVVIPQVPRRSGRVIHTRDRYLGNSDRDGNSILLLLESDEPVTYKAAVSSPHSKK